MIPGELRHCRSEFEVVVLRSLLKPFSHSFSVPLFATFLVCSSVSGGQPAEQSAGIGGGNYSDLDAPEHRYWERELHDPFTAFLKKLESGKVHLDYTSELAYVKSLLHALGISIHTQMLVFSTTSLQLQFISPRNPRAIFFNDSIYLGYIPGGRIEVVSLDPELGGIFYIFDIPKSNRPPVVERSGKCMNCHAKPSVGKVPGIVIKSVLPSQGGGSIDSFRRNEIGHQIPLFERFGGWHVTGDQGINKHWGNQIGRLFKGKISTVDNDLGERFDIDRYPAKSSDILAHLLAEHQAGFVNRVIESSYRARSYSKEGRNGLSPEHRDELKERAGRLVRYLLFADEAKLPVGGIEGDAALKDDFLSVALTDDKGRSLRDFDLRSHIFKYRCSYLIYSPVFMGMPEWFRREVYRQLKVALQPASHGFGHLSVSEKQAISQILFATVSDPVF